METRLTTIIPIIDSYHEELKQELIILQNYEPVHKDILIVVCDQFEYINACIDSIYEHTKDFTLYIWDNGSQQQTASYLQNLKNVHYHRSDENLGYIIPNNRLAVLGSSPYLILLNSDTIVLENWDKTMISWLQMHPKIAAIGYGGSKLDQDFHGGYPAWGYEADYVCGWSLTLRRNILNKFGLFDEEHLQFAYGEDSDFCFRVREMGYQTYVMHLGLVEHFGNCTVVHFRDKLAPFFEANHAYLKRKWFTSAHF